MSSTTNRHFKTSTHSLKITQMIRTGELVVTCFPIVNGEVDTDNELFFDSTMDPQEAREMFKRERAKICPVVTRERAAEIIAQAKASTKANPVGTGLGSFGWDSHLDRVMTADERAAINVNFEGRPGNWTFIRTLMAMAKGK